MICPKCHREIGDELSCSACGFTFRLPKSYEEKPVETPVEQTDDIKNPFKDPFDELFSEKLFSEDFLLSEDSNPFRDILSSTPEFTEIPEEKEEEEVYTKPEPPEPEALKHAPAGSVKAARVNASAPKEDSDYITIGGYIGMLIVAFIPLVSLIVCIVWASSSNTKPNRARFAVAVLVLKAISLLFILGGVVAYFLISARWIFYWFS